MRRRAGIKAKTLQTFIANIHAQPFENLSYEWRTHIEKIEYLSATGRSAGKQRHYEHPVETIEQEWQCRGFFKWPTTEVWRGNGELGAVDSPTEGILGFLGYHVGKSSPLNTRTRQAMLRRVFNMNLPPLVSPEYMSEWGNPASAERLKKMASSIAAFVRSAKRDGSRDMSTAIDEWEDDLTMLYREFYVGKFGFGWPTI